jgi:hypothetical protein
MTSRMFAASIIALGIGLMVVPIETARSGGLVAASSLTAQSPVRPSLAPRAHMSLRRDFPAHMRGFRMSRLQDLRRRELPLWWGYAPDYSNYYPSEYAAPYAEPPYAYQPSADFSERSRPVVFYQPGCRTDTQKVPSETGGERTINITRCY